MYVQMLRPATASGFGVGMLRPNTASGFDIRNFKFGVYSWGLGEAFGHINSGFTRGDWAKHSDI
jgi:hypothetical protein